VEKDKPKPMVKYEDTVKSCNFADQPLETVIKLQNKNIADMERDIESLEKKIRFLHKKLK